MGGKNCNADTCPCDRTTTPLGPTPTPPPHHPYHCNDLLLTSLFLLLVAPTSMNFLVQTWLPRLPADTNTVIDNLDNPLTISPTQEQHTLLRITVVVHMGSKASAHGATAQSTAPGGALFLPILQHYKLLRTTSMDSLANFGAFHQSKLRFCSLSCCSQLRSCASLMASSCSLAAKRAASLLKASSWCMPQWYRRCHRSSSHRGRDKSSGCSTKLQKNQVQTYTSNMW